VFGADHHDWVDTYQKIPKYIDQIIEQSGSARTIELGKGDSDDDFFGSLDSRKKVLDN
jgi:cytochrome P450/NADPH-cytochrome P450 reductase